MRSFSDILTWLFHAYSTNNTALAHELVTVLHSSSSIMTADYALSTLISLSTSGSTKKTPKSQKASSSHPSSPSATQKAENYDLYSKSDIMEFTKMLKSPEAAFCLLLHSLYLVNLAFSVHEYLVKDSVSGTSSTGQSPSVLSSDTLRTTARCILRVATSLSSSIPDLLQVVTSALSSSPTSFAKQTLDSKRRELGLLYDSDLFAVLEQVGFEAVLSEALARFHSSALIQTERLSKQIASPDSSKTPVSLPPKPLPFQIVKRISTLCGSVSGPDEVAKNVLQYLQSFCIDVYSLPFYPVSALFCTDATSSSFKSLSPLGKSPALLVQLTMDVSLKISLRVYGVAGYNIFADQHYQYYDSMKTSNATTTTNGVQICEINEDNDSEDPTPMVNLSGPSAAHTTTRTSNALLNHVKDLILPTAFPVLRPVTHTESPELSQQRLPQKTLSSLRKSAFRALVSVCHRNEELTRLVVTKLPLSIIGAELLYQGISPSYLSLFATLGSFSPAIPEGSTTESDLNDADEAKWKSSSLGFVVRMFVKENVLLTSPDASVHSLVKETAEEERERQYALATLMLLFQSCPVLAAQLLVGIPNPNKNPAPGPGSIAPKPRDGEGSAEVNEDEDEDELGDVEANPENQEPELPIILSSLLVIACSPLLPSGSAMFLTQLLTLQLLAVGASDPLIRASALAAQVPGQLIHMLSSQPESTSSTSTSTPTPTLSAFTTAQKYPILSLFPVHAVISIAKMAGTDDITLDKQQYKSLLQVLCNAILDAEASSGLSPRFTAAPSSVNDVSSHRAHLYVNQYPPLDDKESWETIDDAVTVVRLCVEACMYLTSNVTGKQAATLTTPSVPSVLISLFTAPPIASSQLSKASTAKMPQNTREYRQFSPLSEACMRDRGLRYGVLQCVFHLACSAEDLKVDEKMQENFEQVSQLREAAQRGLPNAKKNIERALENAGSDEQVRPVKLSLIKARIWPALQNLLDAYTVGVFEEEKQKFQTQRAEGILEDKYLTGDPDLNIFASDDESDGEKDDIIEFSTDNPRQAGYQKPLVDGNTTSGKKLRSIFHHRNAYINSSLQPILSPQVLYNFTAISMALASLPQSDMQARRDMVQQGCFTTLRSLYDQSALAERYITKTSASSDESHGGDATKSMFGLSGKSSENLSQVLQNILEKLAVSIARIMISTNPSTVSSTLLYRLKNPLVSVAKDASHELFQFECLMALTNMAALDDVMRDSLYQSGAYQAAQDALFSGNERIQQAAVELLCNMIRCNSVTKHLLSSKGDRDIDMLLLFAQSGDKVPIQTSATGALAMFASSSYSAAKRVATSTMKSVRDGVTDNITKNGELILKALCLHPEIDQGVKKRCEYTLHCIEEAKKFPEYYLEEEVVKDDVDVEVEESTIEEPTIEEVQSSSGSVHIEEI